MSQSITYKVGNYWSKLAVTLHKNQETCRPTKQLNAFIDFVNEHPEIIHYCNTPFAIDYKGEFYKKTMAIRFIDNRGCVGSVLITPTGRVKDMLVSDGLPDMSKYGMCNEQVALDSKREVELTIALNKELNVTHFS